MASGFSFNLENSAIFQTVRWERTVVFRWIGCFKKLFLFIFLLSLPLFLYGFLTNGFVDKSLTQLFGLALLSFTLFWGARYKEVFLNSKLKKPRLRLEGSGLQAKLLEDAVLNPEKYNLADFLSFEVAKVVFQSYQFAKKQKLKEPNSSILLFQLLLNNPDLNFVFSRALLSFKEVKKVLGQYLEKLPAKIPTNFQEAIWEGFLVALKRGHERLEVGDLLIGLAKHDLIFEKILIDSNLQPEDIENLTWWQESISQKIKARKRFWEYENLVKLGSLATQWSAGYTVTLDEFSVDLSEIAKKRGFPDLIGHGKSLAQLERVLSRTGVNSALLVGEPGVGRMSIINALVQKALLGQSLPEINHKRIVKLDIVAILARFKSEEEVTAVLEKIFQEAATAGNVILVVDEFYNFVTQTGRKAAGIDISGILARFLSLAELRLIGITSFYGFHLFIERTPAILQYFEKVEVPELSNQETIWVLENYVPFFEQKNKKFISYPAIRDIVKFSDRYIQEVPFPKKAFDLLDEVLVYTSRYTEDNVVLPAHVVKIVSEKTDIPLGEMEIKERELLLNLEERIHQRIINQEEAVKEVSSALRRARTEVTARSGPMGTFLFLGPTGVGKTETAKALTEIYFGAEKRMLRFDMSEFQNVGDLSRLIGSTEEDGVLTTQVRENPFSLVLLDEIEKAHKNILNLFLQVLDEGFLTDGLGRRVDFKNTIIIATSNAGYQVILKALREKREWSQLKQEMINYLFEEGVFRPEFINRFDGVILFKPLTKENLLDIAGLMLQKLKKNLKEKGIEFVVTEPLKEKVAELGYDPTFGARQMRRVIQDKVENELASALLSEELKRGDTVEVNTKDFKLKINS